MNKKFKISKIFSNNMILQRYKYIKIWGTGVNETKICVDILDNHSQTIVKNNYWEVILKPMKEIKSCKMKIYEYDNPESTLIINNVGIGEVWVAGGQSNMEFLLKYEKNYMNEIADFSEKDIRFFDIPKITYENQLEDFKEQFNEVNFWREMTKEDIKFFSAVAYYFAKDLESFLNVPIGIIGCTYGGISASAWVDKKCLENDVDLNIYIDEYNNSIKNLDMNEYESKYRVEREIYYSKEFQEHVEKILSGTLSSEDQINFFEKFDRSKLFVPIGPKSTGNPGVLYENMLKTIKGYGIRGFLWYQGENDENKANIYSKLFSNLILSWRELWKEDLPFLFVQLTSFNSWLFLNGENFPEIRRQQEKVSKELKDVYMVCSLDCGQKDDIHPKDKSKIGYRLSNLAKNKIYNSDIISESPELIKVFKNNNLLVLEFSNVDYFILNDKIINNFDIEIDGEIIECEIELIKNFIQIKIEDIYLNKKIKISYANIGYTDVNIFANTSLPIKPFIYYLD